MVRRRKGGVVVYGDVGPAERVVTPVPILWPPVVRGMSVAPRNP